MLEATEGARALARLEDVTDLELAELEGSGLEGRVTKADVEAYVAARETWVRLKLAAGRLPPCGTGIDPFDRAAPPGEALSAEGCGREDGDRYAPKGHAGPILCRECVMDRDAPVRILQGG